LRFTARHHLTMSAPVLLDAVLRPSPPLPPRILLAILGFVVLINLSFAVYFVSRGAWPVMPFLGADIALLAWAFRATTLAARREEHITVTPEELRIACVAPKGAKNEVTLNPYWVRVQMDEPADHWSQLTLWSKGRGWRIGAFLAPGERADFALRLKDAIRSAREYRWI
jgi:uncharacterized membrane protein